MTTYRFATAADHPRHPLVRHFARVWANRHSSPAARQSVRDNLRGQRSFRAYEKETKS